MSPTLSQLCGRQKDHHDLDFVFVAVVVFGSAGSLPLSMFSRGTRIDFGALFKLFFSSSENFIFLNYRFGKE